MRVSMIGYGVVAGIHAHWLAAEPGVRMVAVWGRRPDAATAFAAKHGFERTGATLEEALSLADAVVITSPNEWHFRHALQAISRGLHTLVELPPCADIREALELEAHAQRRGVTLQCAHTSRFLVPYSLMCKWIRDGKLGPVQQVTYQRHVVLNPRSWMDDALLHHAAHPVDVFLQWFGDLTPLGCASIPSGGQPHSVSLLARLAESEAPVSVSVSYAAPQARVEMCIVAERHTVFTDGFSHINSDDSQIAFHGDGTEVYQTAIGEQDRQFLRACCGDKCGTPWSETVRLMRKMTEFRRLAGLPTREESCLPSSQGP